MSGVMVPAEPRRAYVGREAMGNLLFGLLETSDPTIGEACAELQITRSQFRTGLAFIKDTLAGVSKSPVTYDPQTHRYSLALQEDEAERYESYRLRGMATQLRRLRTGTAEPAAARFPASIAARRFVRHLEGAQEELALLLAELDG